MQQTITPTSNSNRIIVLDVLRGFAVLGILLMNIQSYSMIEAAYSNPLAFGDLEGWNYYAWWFSHVFADSKFMAIFSLLFGAGIVLFAENAEKKGKKSTLLHYRRNFLLLLFGLFHAYLIWAGDILTAYALCAFVFYWLRNWSVSKLIDLGIFFLAIGMAISLYMGSALLNIPEDTYFAMLTKWEPDIQTIDAEIATFQSSWWAQQGRRFSAALGLQTLIFGMYTFWRAGGLMLIGMGLYKTGFLSAQWSKTKYWLIFVLGLLIGIPIVVYGIDQQFGHGWTMEYSLFKGTMFNYGGSLFIAAAYIAAIQLFVLYGGFQFIKDVLAATGRMALTNYIGQSVICTLIFYGHGLGYFGQVSRFQQLLIVVGIWVFQMVFSYFWMKRFKYGPLEWLWRSLTYGRRIVNSKLKI